MAKKPEKYDAELIRRMLGGAASAKPDGVEKQLPVSELKEGMLLLESVMTPSGQMLLKGPSTLNKLH